MWGLSGAPSPQEEQRVKRYRIVSQITGALTI